MNPPDKPTAHFAKALAAWQARERLNDMEAAARLDVSLVTYGQLLAGNRQPSREVVAHVLERTN